MTREIEAKRGVEIWAPPGEYKLILPEDGGMRLVVPNGETEPPIEPPTDPPIDPPEPPVEDLLDVRDFGAADGQDSTDAWQRACDEAAGTDKIVVGHKDDTYILSHRGTVTMGVYWSRYCVGLRSGTRIDGRGCTFKLADRADALCFTNIDQNGGFRDLDFRNVQHDGNRGKQSGWTDRAQEIGLIGLFNWENVTLEHLNTWDVKGHVARLLNGRRLRMLDCHCRGCDCDVWSIGLDRYPVHDVHVEKAGAVDVRHRGFRHHQGNPLIWSVKGGKFIDIYGEHAGGGHKCQGITEDVEVTSSTWKGGTHGTVNCGHKWQGNQTHQTLANRVRNCTGDLIESSDCPGEGMRFSDCANIHVKKYVGRRNGGPVGQYPDVRFCYVVHKATIDELDSEGCKGHALHAHGTSVPNRTTDVRDLSVGTGVVRNCAGDAVAIHTHCRMEIEQLDCVNVAGRHISTGGGGQVRVKLLRANKPMSISGSGITVDRFEQI